MAEAIAGFFKTRNEAEEAVNALVREGVPRESISLLAGDTRGHETPALGPRQETGSETEAGRDAVIGGIIGLAVGMVAVVLPGIGALIAAGPLAGAIGGLGIGAAAGGIIGVLKDHGISEEEAEFYAEGVRRGGALVTVDAAAEKEEGRIRKIMDRAGAIDTEDLGKELRSTGWEHYDPNAGPYEPGEARKAR